MLISFEGRRVLVTGSTSGIGYAAAEAFLDAGAEVVIQGRSTGTVDGALQRLPGARVSGFAGDLGSAADCERLVREHPDVDVLVSNVGVYGPQDFFEVPDSEWTRFFETNVLSGIRLARAYAPGMVARGWGRIVHVSSESAINIPADMIHYGMTKTAQLAVSRGLAKRLAGTGVTVNAVLPGPTLSEGVAAMLSAGHETEADFDLERAGQAFIESQRSSSVIRRMARVEEVANMILYVSSEQASATTGAALRVDGGVVESIV